MARCVVAQRTHVPREGGGGPPIVQRSRRATRAHLRAWGRRRRRRPDDLMQAARNDDAEAIGRALRAGVDPNTKDGESGRTLAIEAARHGAVNALALLLAATEGAEEQRTESSVTARGGDGGWFVHAQKWESPLWQYSDDGWSPLMHAV